MAATEVPGGNAGVDGEQRYSPCLRRGGDTGADDRPEAREAGLEVSSSRGGALEGGLQLPARPAAYVKGCTIPQLPEDR